LISTSLGVSNFYLLFINFKATLISNLRRVYKLLDMPPLLLIINSRIPDDLFDILGRLLENSVSSFFLTERSMFSRILKY
jgi:hypothetical protein